MEKHLPATFTVRGKNTAVEVDNDGIPGRVCSQKTYEERLFFNASFNALKNSRYARKASQEFLVSEDKNKFLDAAVIVCEKYYECNIPKVTIANLQRSGLTAEIDKYDFDKVTIKDLLLKINEMKNDHEILHGSKNLKTLIIKHKLLPLKSDGLGLDVNELPEKSFLEELIDFPAGLIVFSLVFLFCFSISLFLIYSVFFSNSGQTKLR